MIPQSDDCVYDLLPNCLEDGTLESLGWDSLIQFIRILSSSL